MEDGAGGLPRRMPRRSVVRSLSTMHMMGFTPLGFFETVSEGANLVEGHMSLPTGQPDSESPSIRRSPDCGSSKAPPRFLRNLLKPAVFPTAAFNMNQILMHAIFYYCICLTVSAENLPTCLMCVSDQAVPAMLK